MPSVVTAWGRGRGADGIIARGGRKELVHEEASNEEGEGGADKKRRRKRRTVCPVAHSHRWMVGAGLVGSGCGREGCPKTYRLPPLPFSPTRRQAAARPLPPLTNHTQKTRCTLLLLLLRTAEHWWRD